MRNKGLLLALGVALATWALSRSKAGSEFITRATTEIMGKLSPSGIALLKQIEGERRDPDTGQHVAYLDEAGILTIGWGHAVKPGEPYTLGSQINDAMAEQILQTDTQEAQKTVNDLVTVPLTSNQFDALTSLIFNIGRGNFESSTLLKKLNVGDYEGAAEEFPKWNKLRNPTTQKLVVSAGLTNRRAMESELFTA